MTAYVDLERRFKQLTSKELEHSTSLADFGLIDSADGISWRELLENPRVVLLAEAGAGKTEELKRAAERLCGEGKFAFFLEIEALARVSLPEALSLEDEKRLGEWLEDGEALAWFFLDSVDELKLTQGRFDRALLTFAKGVGSALERVNVVVSCRPHDWQSEADLQSLAKVLPRHVGHEPEGSPADSFFGLLERGESEEKKKQSPVQQIPFLTVVLLPLSDRQVREFVRHCTEKVDQFVAEIDRQHAWDFARRPLDLIELLELWTAEGRLGTRREQHEVNVGAKLRERPGRPDNTLLSPKDAAEGAERLALALALTRTRMIRTPDQLARRESATGVLDPQEVLPDWTEAKVFALLRRALFEPATYGRVRFHHRSVQEYLAACRLVELRRSGMPIKALFAFLFQEMHGTKVLVPSMRPITAWVAFSLEEVRREVIAREPEVLLRWGDPEALALPVRREILKAFVGAYGEGGWRGVGIPIDEVRRLADRRLEPTINELWSRAKANEDTRELLLELMWKCGGADCLDIASEAASQEAYSPYHRMLATRTLQANGQTDALRSIANDLLTSGGGWPQRSVATVASALFPGTLSVEDLLTLVEHTPEPEGATEGFRWQMRQICQEIPLGAGAEKLRQGLVALIEAGKAADASVWQPTNSRAYLSGALRQLCVRQLAATSWGNEAEFVWACVVGHRYRHNLESSSTGDLARLLKDTSPALRQAVFWAEVRFVVQFQENDAWNVVLSALHGSVLPDLSPADRSWLESDLRKKASVFEREISLIGLLWIWRASGSNETEFGQLRKKCRGEAQLVERLDDFTAPPAQYAQRLAYERTRAEKQAERELREELRLLRWDAWRQEVLDDPQRAFSDVFRQQTTTWMMRWLQAGRGAHNTAWDRARVSRAFNDEVADLQEQALLKYWREDRPPLPSERPLEERNTYFDTWYIGLAGLLIESRKRGWAEKLTSEEARLAVRHSTLELNGFPEWLDELAQAQPQIVQDVLSTELRAQVSGARNSNSTPLLQTVSYAGPTIKRLLYATCREILAGWDPAAGGLQHAQHYVEQLLSVVLLADEESEKQSLADVCKQHLAAAPNVPITATWLKALFVLAPAEAAAQLERLLVEEEGSEPIALIAALFGQIGREQASLAGLSNDTAATTIARLIRAAYRVVRPEEDPQHEGVFTPSTRDDAAKARSFLLDALVTTPGRAARDELVALASDPLVADLQERLRHLARERAAADSEFEALQPADIRAMDARKEAPPKSRDAIFTLMMDRLDDLQHDLSHHDFSDRHTLQKIHPEVEMQQTIALRLEAMSRNNYSVTRESEAADSKRTDIVLAAAGSLQKAVIEIKVADGRWRLVELEDALTDQLVQLYQRHDNCRAGCLLMTNNGAKKVWSKGTLRLDWNGLLSHLRALADEVQRQRPELRVGVFGLDLRDPPLTR